MKAHAYAETYSRTSHSEEPQTYYVLRYTLLSALAGGIGSIRTPDPSDFEKIIEKEKAKGTEVIN